MRNSNILILGIAVLCMITFASVSQSVSPPHNDERNVTCSNCHTGGTGPNNTNASNPLGCISCHVNAGVADNKSFSSSDSADGAVSGTSHGWNGSLPTTASPNNAYGLRPASSMNSSHFESFKLIQVLNKYNNLVTCSTCHNAHEGYGDAWSADGTGAGYATSGGSTTVLTDTNQNWTVNKWAGYYLVFYPDSGYAPSNPGQYRLIASNTSNTITVSSGFTSNIGVNNWYYIAKNRNLLRVDNNYGTWYTSMCDDCHYYRTETSGQTNVRTWTGNKLSHPVGITLASVGNPLAYNSVPLKPAATGWAVQTGAPRYTDNGTDNNPTNNMILDSASKIRCLTCHNIHYADSDSSTVDKAK